MVDIKSSVERQFSQVAAHYRTSSVHAAGSELARMVELAGLMGGERVLDAGCGAGHTALAFAPAVAEVVAADLSPAMLAQVQQLAQERSAVNITVQRADVEALPFADGEFDVVTSRYSAHHWPHPQQALHEIRRVLRRDRPGVFLLADIVSYDDFTADTHLQALELLRDPSHVRDHTAGQWLAMLDAAGFDAAVAFTWEVRLEFSSWVQRMATPAQAVVMLQELIDGAPAEVRQALQIEPDHSFTLHGALLRAVGRGA